MPNILDATGLQVSTRAELVAYLTAKFQEIYGVDINLASDTPDGQMMNIYVQGYLDVLDLLVQVFNSFDPDNAIGLVLDQRLAINGVVRRAGTYTVTPIDITNTASVNLYGLDQTTETPFTVRDNAGNQFYLMVTQLGLSVGTHSLAFRAAVPGKQLTTPNSITTAVTIIPSVSNIVNPSGYTVLGTDEELDGAVKVRRQRSVSIASQGYYEGLVASLENLPGVTSAYVYENDTDFTDSDGTPAHSIWVIVAGSALPEDIANVIYRKRNAGAGMRGGQSYNIIRVDGTTKEIRWDNVILQNAFVFFTVSSIDEVNAPNIGLIRSQLPILNQPGVNEILDITSLGTYVQEIDGNTLVYDPGYSNGKFQHLQFIGNAASGGFRVRFGTGGGTLSAVINWNDSSATIQTKLRVIPALAACTVQGAIASGINELTITVSSDNLYNVEAVVTVENNTLLTGASNPILIIPSLDKYDKLEPLSKQKQFVIKEENIIITPMVILPGVTSVVPNSVVTFQGKGGYGAYTYNIDVNGTGATINASTGVYTAGPITGTDQISVTDKFLNNAGATVHVI